MIDNVFYKIGGGAMPILNYAHPLHTFSSTLTYTTTKECWLKGQMNGSIYPTTLTIDGVSYAYGRNTSNTGSEGNGGVNAPQVEYHLGAGSTVTVDRASSMLHILEEA